MPMMFKSLSAMLLLGATIPAHAAVLSGGYAGGNFNDGIMFDVQAINAITLQSLDVNADFGTFDYQVFYRAGGASGFQTDPSAWTLLGNFAATMTNGSGFGTTLDIDDIALGAGSRYGFYITDGGAFSINYTNSAAASGSVQASNADAQLLVGYGVSGVFDDGSADRAFNGALNYTATTAAVPEPATWAMLTIGFGMVGGTLRRRRSAPATAIA